MLNGSTYWNPPSYLCNLSIIYKESEEDYIKLRPKAARKKCRCCFNLSFLQVQRLGYASNIHCYDVQGVCSQSGHLRNLWALQTQSNRFIILLIFARDLHVVSRYICRICTDIYVEFRGQSYMTRYICLHIYRETTVPRTGEGQVVHWALLHLWMPEWKNI